MTWGTSDMPSVLGAMLAALGLALTSRTPARAVARHAMALSGVGLWLWMWDRGLQELLGQTAFLDRLGNMGAGGAVVTMTIGTAAGLIALAASHGAARVGPGPSKSIRSTPLSAAILAVALGYSGLSALQSPGFWAALAGVVAFAGIIGLAVRG